jgi:hypothetical protein
MRLVGFCLQWPGCRDLLPDAERHGIQYEPFSPHAVEAKELQECAKEQNLTFQPGDILLIRFGYTKAWESFDVEKRKATAAGKTMSVGLQQSEEICRFLWDNHFAAVAADNVGLEVVPFSNVDWCIHDHLLAKWGVPIDESLVLQLSFADCLCTRAVVTRRTCGSLQEVWAIFLPHVSLQDL